MGETYNFFDLNLFEPDVNTVEKTGDIIVNNVIRNDLCEDITIDYLPETLEEIELQIDRLKLKWSEFTYLIGQRLKYINDNRMYEGKGYKDFRTYVNLALKMSVTNSYYFMDIYTFFTEEQTKQAGSKLKLLIPILKEIKRDKEVPLELKDNRIKDLRDELFLKVYNKTYREAEKIVKEVRGKYFTNISEIEEYRKIIVKKGKIIINEDDGNVKEELLKLINDFYRLN